MSQAQFDNVSVLKQANVYFDGKVTSRTVILADGSRKTLGLMLAGDYQFDTDAAETMEVLAGEMTVLLPSQQEWQTFKAGQSYDVPAKSSFKLRIDTIADYCCSYK